jgi:hypothetical protein
VIRRLARQALWAPAAVLVVNAIVTRTPYARDVYWLLHLLGGAALAYFFHHVGAGVPPAIRHVLAFALACTVALAWELAEFAIDQLAGTRLQEDLAETMSDLLFAVCGAALYLGAAAFTASRGRGPGGR